MTKSTTDSKLIYPGLSYELVGLMFDIQNKLGGGLREKVYQIAVKAELEKRGIRFKGQINQPIFLDDQKVGNRFLDFLIEDKIVLELKSGERFSHLFIKQINEYLKSTGLRLGILVNFGREEVKFKRIVNLH